MAKYMSMKLKPMLHSNKVIARQTTHKLIQICNIFVSNPTNSLKKQWIIKEANYISSRAMRGKIMSADTNRSSLMSTRDEARHKADPSSCLLLDLIGAFFDCVTIQGLGSEGWVVVIVATVITALFWTLSRNLKRWKRMMMNQSKGKEKGRKWMWIEDLVSSMDVDIFINFCILVGLGIVCGLFVIVRRFDFKNVRK